MAVTYLNEKAKPYVRPLAEKINSPIMTHAASGIAGFEKLLEEVSAHSPERHLVTIEDVGRVATFLVSNSAGSMTGNIIHHLSLFLQICFPVFSDH